MAAPVDPPKTVISPANTLARTVAARPTAVAPKVWTEQELMEEFLKVPNLVEQKNEEVEHVIIYGEPGTGKTIQAALLAEFYHILWFDGDKGLTAVLRNLPPELQARIHAIKIPDSTEYPILVGTMLKVITGRRVAICHLHGAVDCPECSRKPEARKYNIALNLLPKNWVAVFDSQSQFVSSALALSYYKTKKAPIGGDIDHFVQWEKGEGYNYWGGMRNVVETFGNSVKDLKCFFVTISHEMMAEMENGVSKLVPVSGSENASKLYAKYYGTEVHAKKMNNKIIYTSGSTASNTVQTKSRSGVYLEKEKTPALLHMFHPDAGKHLQGSYTEWWLEEGWKHPSDRKRPAPKPKEVLPCPEEPQEREE